MNPSEFFIDEFTKPVILPNRKTTRGIFDNIAENAFDVSATAAQLSLLEADAAVCTDGDILRVDGTEYRVKNREHSDEGITIIHLETV